MAAGKPVEGTTTPLRVVEGHALPPISGEEVMTRVAELIAQELPCIPLDDPFRGSLSALPL